MRSWGAAPREGSVCGWIGLVGVLVEARERGLLPEAASIAEALHRKAGFWLSADLRRLIVG
ncbi:MAG: DUF3368 domain-containing protein [Chthoniobacterales bacterium]